MAEKTLAEIAREAWWGGTGPTSANDWQAVADAVVAAHEARRWRPIETAPKDGEFLVGRWVVFPGGRVWDRGTARYSEYLAGVWQYWTPIPAPPKEADHD